MQPTQVDAIYQAFANHGPAVQAALASGATNLFITLAIIGFVLNVGQIAMRGNADPFEIIAEMIIFAVMVGFWFWVMNNWAAMSIAITDTFKQWGNLAVGSMGGTPNLVPVDFLTIGFNLLAAVWQAASLFSVVGIILIISGFIDVIIFGWIAAVILEIIIESWLAAYVGIVLIALGGNSFTRDFGFSPFRYSISVGVKRLTMQLIAGVTEVIMQTFLTTIQASASASMSWQTVGLMIVMPFILGWLAYKGPKIAQDLIIGTHMQQGAGLLSLARYAAMATVAAGATLAGYGAAGIASMQLASRQLNSQAAGGNGQTGAARAASMAMMTASNAAQSMSKDVGRRLTGQYRGSHGFQGWRMADDMNGKMNP